LTEDINGNRPYQTELDGINEQGELYYNYFFKKVNSDEIAHKMSYAKLYKPFDWVIATGIYLDSLEDYINQETAKMQRIYNRQTVLTVIIAGITILIFMFLIILIEKNLNKLVLSYEDEIKKYTGDLEKLSRTDPLTKLNNRLMLDSTFARAIELARRYDNMFSIILLDVDYFKHVNDRFGHQLGDTILQEFSAILSKNTRAVDVVGRWGGEEFLIICPESNLEGTMNLANNLRQKITGHEFPTVGLVTSSFGVACFKKGDTKESMVERADKALYLAKSNGRNRVEYS
jgi:diguanylate cyclase (GGDEF)-like protein